MRVAASWASSPGHSTVVTRTAACSVYGALLARHAARLSSRHLCGGSGSFSGGSGTHPQQLAGGMDGDKRAKRLKRSAIDGAGVLSHTIGDTIKVPGLVLTSHVFTVPLDYSDVEQGSITLFVRELIAPSQQGKSHALPCLLYLQGGPGMESPRPTEASTWIKSAVQMFRVILMDQRGTGRSSPITVNNLLRVGDPAAQAAYLAHFRADNIVRDAEAVRKALVPREVLGGRWSTLGQSFGGFCSVTYLSLAPEGLVEAMLTGGLAPGIASPCSADEVYRACYARVLTANQRYYARFPQDVAHVQRIVQYLQSQPEGGVRLSSGTLLTPRALQTLGLSGLGSGGGFERLHFLLEGFFDQHGDMNPSFAKSFEAWQPWDTNPLYALLHESIYCQGAASNWSAHRVREQRFAADFDAAALAAADQPVNFTGEMVFPWMFDDFAALRPLKAAAQLLAEKADWPALYRRDVLADNTVPAAAISYVEDLYVDFRLASETAESIQGLKHWMTNEYRHSGIRDDGARIYERLLGMCRDTVFD